MSRIRKLENAFWSDVERRKAGFDWRRCCYIWSTKKNVWLRNIQPNIRLIVVLWRIEKQHMFPGRPRRFIFIYLWKYVIDLGYVCTGESLEGNNIGYQSIWLGEIGYCWFARSMGVEAFLVKHFLERYLADTMCWCLSPRCWKGGIGHWALTRTWIFWLVVSK